MSACGRVSVIQIWVVRVCFGFRAFVLSAVAFLASDFSGDYLTGGTILE